MKDSVILLNNFSAGEVTPAEKKGGELGELGELKELKELRDKKRTYNFWILI